MIHNAVMMTEKINFTFMFTLLFVQREEALTDEKRNPRFFLEMCKQEIDWKCDPK